MAELRIYDFTKRIKWTNFKKHLTTQNEKDFAEYIEAMEKQINLLTAYIHNMEVQQSKRELFDDEEENS